jgi:antitoxin (DNA-binding transcriptional repressor) of toxin-antitoxin stability system
MKRLDVKKANGTLAEYARSLKGEAIVLTSNSKPVAILTPVRGEDWETISLSVSPRFWGIIQRSRRWGDAHGTIAIADVRRRLGLPQRRASRSGKKAQTNSE